MLNYYLEITHVDPIKNDLSLDRFLTIDRIKSGKLPDVDLDFPEKELLVSEAEEDGVEVEFEDGSKKIFPKNKKINTKQGPLSLEEIFLKGIDIDDLQKM